MVLYNTGKKLLANTITSFLTWTRSLELLMKVTETRGYPSSYKNSKMADKRGNHQRRCETQAAQPSSTGEQQSTARGSKRTFDHTSVCASGSDRPSKVPGYARMHPATGTIHADNQACQSSDLPVVNTAANSMANDVTFRVSCRCSGSVKVYNPQV